MCMILRHRSEKIKPFFNGTGTDFFFYSQSGVLGIPGPNVLKIAKVEVIRRDEELVIPYQIFHVME